MLESGRKRFRLINRRNEFGLPPIPFCQVKLRQVKADQIVNYSVNILSKHFGYAFLGMIRIRINGSRSIGSCCIKSTVESLSRMDLSVPLTHWDASDLGSLILIRIIPKESTPSCAYTFNLSVNKWWILFSVRMSRLLDIKGHSLLLSQIAFR